MTDQCFVEFLLKELTSNLRKIESLRKTYERNLKYLEESSDRHCKFINSLSFKKISANNSLLGFLVAMNSFNVNITFKGYYSLLNDFTCTNSVNHIVIKVFSTFEVKHSKIVEKTTAFSLQIFKENIFELAKKLCETYNMSVINTIGRKVENLESLLTNYRFGNKSLENVKKEEQRNNFTAYYDIDAISALILPENIDGIKKDINIKFNISKMQRFVHSKDTVSASQNKICKISEMVSMHIGNFDLSRDHRMQVYFLFPYLRSTMQSNLLLNLKISIHKVMSENFKKISELTANFKYYSQHTVSAEEVFGTISSAMLKKISQDLKEETKASKVVLFIESYNTKFIYSSSEIQSLYHEMNNVFDLEKIKIMTDLCANIGMANQADDCIFLSENFIATDSDIKSFSQLGNDSLRSYHGSTMTLKQNLDTDKLYQKTAGIHKVNFYTPLVTTYFNRSLRNVSFPGYSASLLLNSMYSFNEDAKVAKYQRKRLSELEDVKTLLSNGTIRKIGLRLEIRTCFYNLLFFPAMINNLVTEAKFLTVPTAEVKSQITTGMNLLLSFKDSKLLTFNDIARYSMLEISFFEFFMKGGKNRHIIPKELKSRILDLRANEKFLDSVEKFEINSSEEESIIEKLVKYFNKAAPSSKIRILKLFEFYQNTNQSEKIRIMAENFIEDICRLYSKPIEIEKFKAFISSNTFISFAELYTLYFYAPDESLRSCLYLAMYEVLKNISTVDAISNAIEAYLKINNFKSFYFKDKNSRTIYRNITFNKTSTSEDVATKLKYIHDHCLYRGLTTESGHKNEFTCSEKIVLEAATKARSSGNPKNCLSAIIADFRYPFAFYCEKPRLTQGRRRLTSGRLMSVETLQEQALQFHVESFSLKKIVKFLNINLRYLDDIKSIEYIDELNALSFERQFIPREEAFYQQLFEKQVINRADMHSYQFLNEQDAEDLNHDVKIEVNNFSESLGHLNYEDDNEPTQLNENNNLDKEIELETDEQRVYLVIKDFCERNDGVFVSKRKHNVVIRYTELKFKDYIEILKQLKASKRIAYAENEDADKIFITVVE